MVPDHGAEDVDLEPTVEADKPPRHSPKAPRPIDALAQGETQAASVRSQLPGIPETMDLVDRAPEWESPGQLIGTHYKIIERLGAGGCGVTYRACDTTLDRDVALKRLRAPERAARNGIQRFLREAQAIAHLNHRNIVMIHELGEDSRGPFIVMEYLAGGDLLQKIERNGPMETGEALAIIEAVGQGLAYAHQKIGTVTCFVKNIKNRDSHLF